MLFLGPADQDMEWQDAGIEGVWRFLNRLWRVVHEQAEKPRVERARHGPLARKAHETIAKVTDDIDRRFAFNTPDRGGDGAGERDRARARTTRPRASPPRRPSR